MSTSSILLKSQDTLFNLSQRIGAVSSNGSYESIGLGINIISSSSRNDDLVRGLIDKIPFLPDFYDKTSRNELIRNLIKLDPQIRLGPIMDVFRKYSHSHLGESKKLNQFYEDSVQKINTLTDQKERINLQKDTIMSLETIQDEFMSTNRYVKETPVDFRLMQSTHSRNNLNASEVRKSILNLLLEEHEIIQLNYLLVSGLDLIDRFGNTLIIPSPQVESDLSLEDFAIRMRLSRVGFLIISLMNLRSHLDGFDKDEMLELKGFEREINLIEDRNKNAKIFAITKLYKDHIYKKYIVSFLKFSVMPRLLELSSQFSERVNLCTVKTPHKITSNAYFEGSITPYGLMSNFRINPEFVLINSDTNDGRTLRHQIRRQLVQHYFEHYDCQNKLYQLAHDNFLDGINAAALRLTKKKYPQSLPKLELETILRDRVQAFVDGIKGSVQKVAKAPGKRKASKKKILQGKSEYRQKVLSHAKRLNHSEQDRAAEAGSISGNDFSFSREDGTASPDESVSSCEELSFNSAEEFQDPTLAEPAVEEKKEKSLFSYDFRASRWLTETSLEERLNPDFFPEYQDYSNQRQKEMIYFHGFSSQVDQFYTSGFRGEWVNRTTFHLDTQYVLPAEFNFDGKYSRGAIIYCFGQDGLCYHRYFEPMNAERLLERFKQNVFEQADFPELTVAEAMRKDKSNPSQFFHESCDEIQENEYLNTVSIRDARLNILITIFKK